MTTDTDLIAACLAAWTKCPAAGGWPRWCDTIMVADFQGGVIFWPQLDGESFSIVRLSDAVELDDVVLSDAVELDDVVLPGWLALQLHWRELRLGQPAQLAQL